MFECLNSVCLFDELIDGELSLFRCLIGALYLYATRWWSPVHRQGD